MLVKDFDYDLPDELIAQTPLEKRDASRLLVLNHQSGEIEHRFFDNIIDYFNEGDVLVLNDSRVIPARLYGEKKDTRAIVEILLISEEENDVWQCLVKPFKKIKIGTELIISSKMTAICLAKKDDGIALFQFFYKGNFLEVLEKLGEMPLPPYITAKLKDKDRYQTVYAKKVGSIAAPTAGLHFTNDIMLRLQEKKVTIVYITLHVGIGTFRPVKVEKVVDHKMHREFYEISQKTADILNDAKANKNKIISVGTTTTRTLESIYHEHGLFKKQMGFTDVFIYPGFEFRAIDALITNFHLPKSTLLMLVSAFATKDYIATAYQEAIKYRYRFFSFGDVMLIK